MLERDDFGWKALLPWISAVVFLFVYSNQMHLSLRVGVVVESSASALTV